MQRMVRSKRGHIENVEVVPEGKKYRLPDGRLVTARSLHPVDETTGGPLEIARKVDGIKVNPYRLIERMMYRNDRHGRYHTRQAVEAGCTTFMAAYRHVVGRFGSLRDCPRAFRRGFAHMVADEFSRLSRS